MKQLLCTLLALSLSVMASAEDFLNIRTNPFMVFGYNFVNLEIDVRRSENWAIGGFVQTSTNEPLFDAGLRLTYFESGAFQAGWMTGMDLFYAHVEEEDLYYSVEQDSFCRWDENEECGLSAVPRTGLRVDHGYLWRWGTFNAGLGVGAAVQTNPTELADWAVVPALHFSIGWIR